MKEKSRLVQDFRDVQTMRKNDSFKINSIKPAVLILANIVSKRSDEFSSCALVNLKYVL